MYGVVHAVIAAQQIRDLANGDASVMLSDVSPAAERVPTTIPAEPGCGQAVARLWPGCSDYSVSL